jgi:hypothetical protein
MKESNIEYYIKDTFLLLKENARDAKKRRDIMAGTPDHQYCIGYLTAFYDVISLLQSQAIAFDIPLSELGLDDLHPEQELL